MSWSRWLLVIPAVLLPVASAGPALAARGGDPVRPLDRATPLAPL
jgi:hypothetical protein